MDAIKIIENLAKKARQETPPQVDVSKTVMLEIGILRQETAGFLPLEFFAGISAVAASIIMFFSIHAWQYIVNPLVQLFVPFQEVLPW